MCFEMVLVIKGMMVMFGVKVDFYDVESLVIVVFKDNRVVVVVVVVARDEVD